jgi:hypothetical protein
VSDQRFDEDALLDATRRVLSPTQEQSAQVLRATRAVLASTAAAAALAPTPASAAPHAPLPRAWLPSAIGAVSIAVVSGVIGYQLGLRTSERRSVRIDAVAEVSAPTPQALAVPATVPVARTPKVPSVPLAPSMPARAPSQRPTRAAAELSEPSASSMQAELDAMRRVDRALHDHDPRRALGLLYQLERDVPEGALTQEREAAFAMARCALGLGSAQQLERDFAARHPDSVYLARVHQTCGPDQRNAAQPDTHE